MPRSNEKKFPTVGLVDYGTSDHAAKYPSTAGTQAPVGPSFWQACSLGGIALPIGVFVHRAIARTVIG